MLKTDLPFNPVKNLFFNNSAYFDLILKVQFSSVAQLCPTLCNPMDCSAPGSPVLHYLQELAQTHVHWVSDTIQPSHPLSPSLPSAFRLSQQQGLFQWVSSSHLGIDIGDIDGGSWDEIFGDLVYILKIMIEEFDAEWYRHLGKGKN